MDKDREQPEPLRAAVEVAQQRPLADIRGSKASLADEIGAMRQWVLNQVAVELRCNPANQKNQKFLTGGFVFTPTRDSAGRAQITVDMTQDFKLRPENVELRDRIARSIRENLRDEMKKRVSQGEPIAVDEYDPQSPQRLLTVTADSLAALKEGLFMLAPAKVAQR